MTTSEIDALADDYVARVRRGEQPAIGDYASRHPALAGEIRALFPVLAAVEGAAPSERDPEFPGLEIHGAHAPGAGGMGVVYRARERSLERIVAVKTTRAHLDTPDGRAFFENEARAAARLDHPHIVRVFSFDPAHRPPYYVMQWIDGVPLDDACRGRAPRAIAELFEKVARALDYAHGQRVVHRDIKPQNVLVDFAGEPHITDFGLAERIDALLRQPASARTGVRGTPHYLAPELLAGGVDASPATDVYALGVTMYQMLTGRLPFTGGNLAELRAAVAAAAPPLPVELDAAIPEPLQRICLLAMEPDPAHRYASARMLADDLRRWLEGREVFARPTRYLRERGGKLENHLTDIALWHDQRLFDTRETDRLARPYRRMLDGDSAWDALSRRFPWETALLRLGGWLAVVSSILWLAFYWGDLVRAERVAALAVPCVLVNAAGWMYHARGSRLNAAVFLSTGSLLWPMLVAVVLAEYGWCTHPQPANRELLGVAAVLPRPDAFVLTNAQINAIAAAFLAYALTLLRMVRAPLFAFWSGIGIYASYTAALLLCGLRFWLDTGDVSRALVGWLAGCLAFVPIAGVVHRSGRTAWAAILYAFFPLPCALLLTLLARFGGEEWLGCTGWHDRGVQLWLLGNGLLYLALGRAHARDRIGYRRAWGELFLLLVPVSLLVPNHVLLEEPPFLGTIGAHPVSLWEIGALLIGAALVVFGTRVRRIALVAPGVCGLAVALVRITGRHFEGELAWPIALAVIGGSAMVAGAVSTYVRERRATTSL